ncbi:MULTISPECIES: FAD-dependent oxidoreductase [unclassified Synechococcus]|uniref:FAD-dependent oxidoreductase n=1 Tax=unclassified Synechococcus TaxID=2626047 RepID=UPI0020CFA374|nr:MULTISPECIES: FAD-dependent oxidoreductase [unclassified Synechococcus]
MWVIGGGLAGSLLALALAERGARVRLLDPAPAQETLASSSAVAVARASALSYGGVPWWAGPPDDLGALMATAPACWQRLEARHGPLGWRPCGLRLRWEGGESPAEIASIEAALAGVQALAGRHLPAAAVLEPSSRVPRSGSLRLPYGRVDGRCLAAALPLALERAGVERQRAHAGPLLAGPLPADQVVLAAGASCRSLLPALPERLRVSWAGLLAVEDAAACSPLLPAELAGGDEIVMPLLGQRQGLEARAAQLQGEEWVVDAGLAPWGKGLLLGQTTLVRAGLAKGEPPDPLRLEAALRNALAAIDPRLAEVRAPFHQAPVSFTSPGGPLVGPVAGRPGLWVFAGFSGPFALVPPLAPLLAAAIGGDRNALARLPGC